MGKQLGQLLEPLKHDLVHNSLVQEALRHLSEDEPFDRRMHGKQGRRMLAELLGAGDRPLGAAALEESGPRLEHYQHYQQYQQPQQQQYPMAPSPAAPNMTMQMPVQMQ